MIQMLAMLATPACRFRIFSKERLNCLFSSYLFIRQCYGCNMSAMNIMTSKALFSECTLSKKNLISDNDSEYNTNISFMTKPQSNNLYHKECSLMQTINILFI